MKAVFIKDFGGPENLEIREVPDPRKPQGSEVLVRVRAAGLNRADIIQRRGSYPPPAGYSPNIPGLEFAGEVILSGEAAKKYRPGDRVFGITAGEAQAELLLIDESLLARIPPNIDLVTAAAFPEAFITAHDAIFTQAGLVKGETLLVHAIGSGVGLAALQLARQRGCLVIGTSRTADKLERCARMGLDSGILIGTNPDFADEVLNVSGGRGADVILDLVGGAYFASNLGCAALKGRMMLVGLTSGAKAEFNMGIALGKRLKIVGTVLRARTVAEKAEAVDAFAREVVPLIANGNLAPNTDRVFSMTEIREAHQYMESNESFGKVVLELGA